MRRLILIVATLCSLPLALVAAPRRPALAVLIVVDQMRADYLTRFRAHWTGGLKRLVDEGASFSEGAYPYLSTVTCVGHSTIGTGTLPLTHGVVQNTWVDRRTGAVVPCTDDPSVDAVNYSGEATAHYGVARLRVPTFGDAIRANGGHVVALALKARSAMMLAGRGGDAVTWASDAMDGWQTSTQYAQAPVSAVAAYVQAHPIDADAGQTWTLSLPASRYAASDDVASEDPPSGWGRTFPHPLGRPTGTAKDRTAFYDRWQQSPFADAYVARMAASLADTFELGRHAQPDLLAVSFSTPDLLGHNYGPDSREVEDAYVRLDASIGTLLAALDRSVGRGRYVVALSADHGVAALPEVATAAGRDAGRASGSAAVAAVNAAVAAQLGADVKADARLTGTEVTLRPDVMARLSATPGAVEAVARALAAQPGVRRVFSAAALTAPAAPTTDADLIAARLSYMPGVSGDFLVALKEGWIFSTSGTTHGSANAYDQRVPVLLYGTGIRRGRPRAAATPADLTPTLAHLTGVPFPSATGRVLREALR